MIYNLSNPLEKEQFKSKANLLYQKGKIVELTEKKQRKQSEEEIRTNRQNRTFHMWVSVVADELGYTSKEDCKYDIKKELLGVRPYENIITGKTENRVPKTSEMSISELSSFMDRFKAWASTELGVYLPYYGDAGYEEMVQQYKNR